MDIVPQLIANSIVAGAIYTILVLGFNLTFSVTRFLDIGYGVLITAGGYSALYVSRFLGLPFAVGILAGILASGLLGFISYKLVYAPLRKRKAGGGVLLISSLGVLLFVQAIIAIFFTSQFQSLSGFLASNPTYELWGGTMTWIQLVTLGIAALLCFAVFFVLRYTMFGKMFTAISDDEEVSKMIGINTEKAMGAIFCVAGMLAGLGGILIGLDTGVEPAMGLFWLLSIVSTAIIGGIGNVYGGIAGAFFVAFIENFVIWKIPGQWRLALIFTVLLMFLVWRPKGLFPR